MFANELARFPRLVLGVAVSAIFADVFSFLSLFPSNSAPSRLLLILVPLALAFLLAALSEFPSNTFYEGSLQNGVTAAERKQVRFLLSLAWRLL